MVTNASLFVQIFFHKIFSRSELCQQRVRKKSGSMSDTAFKVALSNPLIMLKRFLAFLIFLSLSVQTAGAESCPASTSTISTDLEITALYPNPNTGEEEWIELTNNDHESVDLSLYTLEDATAHPWAPSGTLNAGSSTRVTGFSFALNNSNETVTLKTSTGTQIDTWSYASSTKGEILYRDNSSSTSTVGDTTATTTSTTSTTTTTTNTTAATTPTQWPSFSEALPNPSGSDSAAEWIELYNAYSEPLTLDGLKLDDEDGGSSPHSLSGTLAGESYLLVPINESNITLNNTTDHIRLLGVNNEVLWDVPYNDVQEGYSYASLYGSYSWTDTPTPGEENTVGTVAPSGETDGDGGSDSSTNPSDNGDLSDVVTLTEVFPDPAGTDNEEEWIELTNGGTSPIDLGNWTITDASGKSFTFPGGTIIQPGESLVIYRTESGISLNNSNESIQLADYTGEVVSEVSYDSSEEDESYAEIEVETSSSTQASTSGLGNPSFSTWQWVDPSPGVKNPTWKQIKGIVAEWDGQWLTMNDGLSNWTFEATNSDENTLLFKTGNTVLVQAAMVSGIYQIMHSELVESGTSSSANRFPWSWILSGLAALSWIGYEIYKKRKKVWTLEPQALN
jgi:hypothetical protein